MRLKYLRFLLFLLILTFVEAKRSGGRSRGSSSRSTSFWTKKSAKSESVSKPVASAPEAPKTTNVQSNTRPIGWDVDNSAKKNVNPVQSAAAPPSYHQSAPVHPPPYSNGQNPAYPPAYQSNSGYPTGQNPVHPPSYQPNAGYPTGQHNTYPAAGYPAQPPSYQQAMGGYPQQNHGYGGYPQAPHQQQGFRGVSPPPNYQHMGGYGHQNHNPYQTGIGSLFGGKKHGFGGGGFGGMGSYTAYNHAVKKSGGFFGKHAFRNVLGGLFVWYMISGLFRRPYKVYNYYNQPAEEREELKIPSNVLALCAENATNICIPGTTGICTLDNKILCVTTLATASPCADKPGGYCVQSTIPCVNGNDPLCQNKTADNTATVNMPCFTKLTITPSQNTTSGVPVNQSGQYCVTTMAVPDPDVPTENAESVDEVTGSSNSTKIEAVSPDAPKTN